MSLEADCSQGNEAEALRSWRSALDNIYYHNAYRVPAGYIPKTETEKALKDSLRNMEMQCKERVDLLEALKMSRQEQLAADGTSDEPSNGKGKIQKPVTKTPRQSNESTHGERGFIGDGTIPAVDYPDLSKPALPKLPPRPSMISKSSSSQAVVGARNYSSSSTFHPASSSTALAPPIHLKKSSRSPSPEKGRTMLHTLRSSDRSGRHSSSSKTSRLLGSKKDNIVTNKAATLAWNSVGKLSREKLGRSLDADFNNSTASLSEAVRKDNVSDPTPIRPRSSSQKVQYDSRTRRLVSAEAQSRPGPSPVDLLTGKDDMSRYNGYPFPPTDLAQSKAVSGTTMDPSILQDLIDLNPPTPPAKTTSPPRRSTSPPLSKVSASKLEPLAYPTYYQEYPETSARKSKVEYDISLRRKAEAREEGAGEASGSSRPKRKPIGANISSPRHRDRHTERDEARKAQRKEAKKTPDASSLSFDDETNSSSGQASKPKRRPKQKQKEDGIVADIATPTSEDSDMSDGDLAKSAWKLKVRQLMKNLPKGVDESAAKQIFNEIVVHGDEVHWDDVAGLDIAKNALKEAVVYPFLRPDLFMGLREPARGMLLFGPPGTGKTMLARAVATESKSTFFSISASSLTSKYLGESEKLVRALFSIAKALAPSIIFVDEIDSLLSQRSGSGEHEATRRIKTEFLIQWSDLQRAAAGREQTDKEKEKGDASRVLVLAATNLPWAIDEAARRRFVRRQYIPLPEDETRAVQLRTLLGHQKHSLGDDDIQRLVELTDGMFFPSLPTFKI